EPQVLQNVKVVEGINLWPGTDAWLQLLVDAQNYWSDVNIEIGVYTDNKGSAAAKRQLSQRRAEVIREWLVQHGIDKSRISIKGYGATNFIADNDTEEGREKNNRVEVKRISGDLRRHPKPLPSQTPAGVPAEHFICSGSDDLAPQDPHGAVVGVDVAPDGVMHVIEADRCDAFRIDLHRLHADAAYLGIGVTVGALRVPLQGNGMAAAHVAHRPFDFLGARTLVTEPGDLLEQDTACLGFVLGSGGQVHREGTAGDLVVVEGVHGVGQPALSAHLLEEAPAQARGDRLDAVQRTR